MSIEFECSCGIKKIVHNRHPSYYEIIEDIKKHASFICLNCGKPMNITNKER